MNKRKIILLVTALLFVIFVPWALGSLFVDCCGWFLGMPLTFLLMLLVGILTYWFIITYQWIHDKETIDWDDYIDGIYDVIELINMRN